MKFSHFFPSIVLLFLCCSTDGDPENEAERPTATSIYVPKPGTSFEWRLDNLPDNYTTTAEAIDIDAFSATKELVSNLQEQGKKVIAYISVWSIENFRQDADQFPQEVVGAVYEGFEDENWLDVRNINVIGPILKARLDMIKEKGFDAAEPDNLNGYQNNTGFPLTQADAIIFSRWLIKEAHERGLFIG